ncbi:alpha/beta-hydrolase [Ganoderma leucocontextum]|nr:alpha/beta-hydrolase [Ganoderma leucocontextum]
MGRGQAPRSTPVSLIAGARSIKLQDGKQLTAKYNMDNLDRKAEHAASPRSQGSPSGVARTLLFAVAVAVTAGFPATAGFRNVNHGLFTSDYLGALAGPSPMDNTTDFDWESLKPSTDIKWAPCYDGHQCARLLLPLDYLSNNSSGATTAIALRMIPARDRANYRGTVLLNPGGPGGSGTGDFMTFFGQNVSTVVGDSFDVLAFDPRGIGASTPRLECFASQSERDIWNSQEGHQLLDASDDSVLNLYSARAKVLADRCAQRSAAEGDIGRFMSTASVATDMLKITEKLGQEKLQYWGFSYGSVLGQYFAAMYPDKVGRLIIDGVFDGNNYRSALWNSNLVDNEAVIDSLFTFCHQAGPLNCALYETTPAAISERYYDALEAVKQSPVPIPLAEPPLVLTYKDLINQILSKAYSPIAGYQIVVTTIRAIETGNQTLLAALAPYVVSPVACDCAPPAPPNNEGSDALFAIACGDADAQTFDRAAFRAFFADLTRVAPTAGPAWAVLHLGCTQGSIRPRWRYTGPLAAQNTSHPLLIVQPKFDPVCPLRDARVVRERYGGAGLLVQDSYGHCSLSAPSVCTAKHVRAYFEEGTLPAEGTVCEPDVLPLVGRVSGVQARSEEDERLLEALRGLTKGVPMFGGRR